jgi:hypothetical protein
MRLVTASRYLIVLQFQFIWIVYCEESKYFLGPNELSWDDAESVSVLLV